MTATVLSGPERRWTTAEKLRIVEESRAPDAMVSEIARRHDVHPNQVHSWRRQARIGVFGGRKEPNRRRGREASQEPLAPMREKFSCRSCESITQPPAPSHPIARGRAAPGLLA